MNPKPDGTDFKGRIADLLADPNNAFIPRVPRAGLIDPKGGGLVMHNGIQVFPDSYYGAFGNEAIKRNRGVHEPQEEYLFGQVLECLPTGSVMVELGAYWGFYSMWFASKLADPRVVLVEADATRLETGVRNFELNDLPAPETVLGYAGSQTADVPPGVDKFALHEFMQDQTLEKIHLLHLDIQGAECDFLLEVYDLLVEGRIDYLFVSTHSDEHHYSSRAIVEAADFLVLDSVDFGRETFCYDGILVACRPDVDCAIRPCLKKNPGVAPKLSIDLFLRLARRDDRLGRRRQARARLNRLGQSSSDPKVRERVHRELVATTAAHPAEIPKLIEAGHLALAETYCRVLQEEGRESREVIEGLREIEAAIAAVKNCPDGYLLIKAWGEGFWSDVHQVLGGLLLAELSGRKPVIHWGKNSKFGPWTEFFEAVSEWTLEDVSSEAFDFFPEKWKAENLEEEDVRKFEGEGSRLAGFQFLRRPEKVAVFDFFIQPYDLLPWIEADSPHHGKTTIEVTRELIRKYLKPNAEIRAATEAFRESNLEERFLSVHIRGTDKGDEIRNLSRLKGEYLEQIERIRTEFELKQIFLMTDDHRILDAMQMEHGDSVVYTGAERGSGGKGIHFKDDGDGARRAREVLIDTLVAAEGDAFLGGGYSNPSLFVSYLKEWENGKCRLIGSNVHEQRNTLIHDPYFPR